MNSRGFEKLARIMRRPESRLAAGCTFLLLAVVLLVNVALVSCEGGHTPRTATAQPSAESAIARPPNPAATPGDYRLALITAEPRIRVRIGSAQTQLTISGAAIDLGPSDPAGAMFGQPVLTLRTAGNIRLDAGFWVLTAKANGAELCRIPVNTGLLLRPQPEPAGLPGHILINGSAYPAPVRLVARSESAPNRFDAVAHLALEDYLAGVVSKEMLAGWPAAAYRVQAVCARSYALHELMRQGWSSGSAYTLAKSHFDVDGDERDQAYGGATSNKAAIAAVRDTRGQVLADGALLLRAYYSSTCGGRTASAKDTWPTGPGYEFNLAPPLQAAPRDHACQKSPTYRWSIKRDRSDLAARFKTYGEKNQLLIRKLRDLAGIEVAAVNADGRPVQYKITEPGGAWYQLSAEQLRLACNQSGANPTVSSSDGIIMGVAIGPLPDVDRKSRIPSGDLEMSLLPSSPGSSKALATLSGRGFGHGVGMCQYCAKGFAERNEPWQTTLLRFYPGAKLVNAY